MTWQVEQVGDGIVDGNEALQLPRELKPFHHLCSPSCWLVEIFSPVIQSPVRSMPDTGHEFSLGGSVRAQLVSDHNARRCPLAFEQFLHEALGRLCITPVLHQRIQYKTVLVDRAPQPVFLAAHRNHNLVEMPLSIGLAS